MLDFRLYHNSFGYEFKSVEWIEWHASRTY